jgi:hypothetical protein
MTLSGYFFYATTFVVALVPLPAMAQWVKVDSADPVTF